MEPTIRQYARYRVYQNRHSKNRVPAAHSKRVANGIPLAVVAGVAMFVGLCIDASATMAAIAFVGAIAAVVYATSAHFAARYGFKHKAMRSNTRIAIVAGCAYVVLLAFFIVFVAANGIITWDAFIRTGGFFLVGLPTLLITGLIIRAWFKSK